MHKTLKIILLVLLILLGVGILGVWYAASSINPVRLTQLLSSSVKEATGRDLKITGPVSLRIFPSVGITADQASLSNASWGKSTALLTVKHLELDIEILPLLKKEVAFNAIKLDGVELHLQTNKAGDGNWDFSTPAPGASSTASSSSSAFSSIADASAADQSSVTRIRSLALTNAHLRYQAFGSTEKYISIPKLSLDGSGDETQVFAQAQYADYQLGIQGKTSALRKVLADWNVVPTNVKVDLTLSVNGKSLTAIGDIQKQPQTLPSFDLKLSSKSFEIAPLAGTAALASAGGSKTNASNLSQAQGPFVFSDEALPFDLLPEANGKVLVDMDELRFPGHIPLTAVKGELVFDHSHIHMNHLTFALGKGNATVQANIAQFQSANPTVAIKGLAKGFTLEQLVNAVDSNTQVKGGDTELAFNLRSSGISLHQLASKATGALQLSVGKGSIDSRFIDRGGDLMITVVNAINPMRKTSDQTTLECAVFYLPMSNGQVTINDSIGVVTDRLDIVLSGSVDLKTEGLNMKIDPREKSGLTTGVDLAGLVKLQGTLQNPKAGVNKEGVVSSAVSIGLGILTGGATILAENAKSLATKSQPCKAALHPWSDIYPGTN